MDGQRGCLSICVSQVLSKRDQNKLPGSTWIRTLLTSGLAHLHRYPFASPQTTLDYENFRDNRHQWSERKHRFRFISAVARWPAQAPICTFLEPSFNPLSLHPDPLEEIKFCILSQSSDICTLSAAGCQRVQRGESLHRTLAVRGPDLIPELL